MRRRALLSAALAAPFVLSGRYAIAQSSGRTYWTTAPVFYCDPVNGDDTKDGLSLANAFKTLTGAYTAIRKKHDFGGTNPKLQLVDGVYNAGSLYTFGPLVGAELLLVNGNETYPERVKLYAWADAPAIYARDQAILQLYGLSFTTGANGATAIVNDGQGAVIDIDHCRFGYLPGGAHVVASTGGFVNFTGQSWIDGGAISHMRASSGAQIVHAGTCTVAAGLSFTDASGARTPLLSVAELARYYGGVTFNGPGAGSATMGKQYDINDARAYFAGTIWPGDVAGSIA